MNIRSKLTLRFTIIVSAIILLFALAIYYFSATFRTQEFYQRLNEKALNTAKLLVEIDDINGQLLKTIQRNTITLQNEKIHIYDGNGNEIFNTTEQKFVSLKSNILKDIQKNNTLEFRDGELEALGLYFKANNTKAIVIISAYDKFGIRKLGFLKIVLFVSALISIIVVMLAGWLFAGRALTPISGVVSEVENITASNLSQRVNEGNGTDEIAQLAVTFNQMLNRIEIAFQLQKSFVSNASHELRTPLTSITGQLEVALMKERKNDEYRETITSVLDDIKSMNSLSNGLLELMQTEIQLSDKRMKNFRADEMIWNLKKDISKNKPQFNVHININNLPDDEQMLFIKGDETLIKSGITNLVENACKFSENKTAIIDFNVEAWKIIITVSDNGIGISKNEISKIFEPFYRGSNTQSFNGHGIGLSLTKRIMDMHKAQIIIASQENEFTKIKLLFPTI